MSAFEQLAIRTDIAYQRWLASTDDDVLSDDTIVIMFCRDSLRERNATYGIAHWLPDHLMIGQEGDRGYFLTCDGAAGPVLCIDLGALTVTDGTVVAPTFEEWLHTGFTLPPEPESERLSADVYVDRVAADSVQILYRLRKLLGATWSFSDLRALLADQPFLAVRACPTWVLQDRLEQAPDLRPFLFHDANGALEPVWPHDRGTAPASNLVDG